MNILQELLKRNLAYVMESPDPFCQCPPLWDCEHLTTYKLIMSDTEGNEQEVDLWDSEEIGKAYNSKQVTA